MRRLTCLFLALLLLVSMAACGGSAPPASPAPDAKSTPTEGKSETVNSPAEEIDKSAQPEDVSEPEPEPEPEPVPDPEPVLDSVPYAIYDPTIMPEGGVRDGVTYVAYNGIVEHLFFHPVIAYPEQAFDGDHMSNGYDDWMVTVGEYNKILQSVYEKGFVLVDIMDCWSESTDENGISRMVKNTLYLPEGKKPLIISYDDVNYNLYTFGDGFTYKLIFGEDGKLWSWGLDPQGNEVVSRDLDAITILDKFVEEHPDFSPFGAKGCLSITGYEGILGYRTQTDRENWTAEREAARQKEIELAKPIVAELKRTGWTFGSHTWGHISLDRRDYDTVTADMQRWFDEVSSLVGETSVIFYPFGGRLDGDDVQQTGPAMEWMVENGFRIFCSVGINSWSKIKKDTCAVICDRLHPDGTTLRGSDKVLGWYSQFYDARDIIDLDVRPEREVRWTPKVAETPAADILVSPPAQ